MLPGIAAAFADAGVTDAGAAGAGGAATDGGAAAGQYPMPTTLQIPTAIPTALPTGITIPGFPAPKK
jgi:hypothetical protein